MIVRISILRTSPGDFAKLVQMMADAEAVLAPGIKAMSGFIGFYAGNDEATSSMTNTSFWQTLEDAKQLDSFAPMLALGKEFVAAGAKFERPVMNYAVQWQIGSHG